MKDIKIYCSYFNKQQIEDYNITESDIIKPFYTNAVLEGNSINNGNRFWCENVTPYYIWKNNIKSDIVGFYGYRRPFYNVDFDKITDNSIYSYGYADWSLNSYMSTLTLWCGAVQRPNYIFFAFVDYMKEKYGIDFAEWDSKQKEIMFYNRSSFIFTWNGFCKWADAFFGLIGFIGEKHHIDWKKNPEEFYDKIITTKHTIRFKTNIVGIIFEAYASFFVNFLFDKIYLNHLPNKAIVTECDDFNTLTKMYTRNLKTGIQTFFNISPNIDINCHTEKEVNDLKHTYQLLRLFETKDDAVQMKYSSKYYFMPYWRGGLNNFEHIYLKPGEYIDCDNNFEYAKGNYKIKTL